MTAQIAQAVDLNGKLIASNVGRPFSPTTVSFILAANTPTTIGVPPNSDIAFFEYSKATPVDVWVDIDGDANEPNAGGADGLFLLEDGDELLLEDGDNLLLEGNIQTGTLNLNPDVRNVTQVDELSFFCTTQTFVSVEFYPIYKTHSST